MSDASRLQALLGVEDLSIDIGGARLVDGVTFALAQREVLALVGESGCGKSLTALAILGLLPPAAQLVSGKVLLAGIDLTRLDETALGRIRGARASMIFQEPTASLDPLATVGAQIAEAILLHEPIGRRQARERALAMLQSVGIPDAAKRLDQYPFELSGGTCQRIMIAIALACGPGLLIADEPTTALDVTIQADILDLIRRLIAERGTGVLLITHDMGVVADMADRVAVMYAGRIAEIAAVETLFAEPRHPYTRLLLESVPRLEAAPKDQLATIEGSVPSARDLGAGCRFASRCPLAAVRCYAESPPLATVGTAHQAACWRSDAVAEMRAHAA
jgi:peptide/nickel transport system ATP-binding protein